MIIIFILGIICELDLWVYASQDLLLDQDGAGLHGQVGHVTAAEDEGQQVEWSLEESQELLDEVSAESTREDSIEENGEPMDDAVTASIGVSIKKDPVEVAKKVPEDGVVAANESCANDAAIEIGTRDTASSDVRVKKDPVEDVGQEGLSEPKPKEPKNCAKDELSRQRLKSSSGIGSKLLDKFASSEGEKEVPEEPPEDENKNGGIRSDAESIVVGLYYNYI